MIPNVVTLFLQKLEIKVKSLKVSSLLDLNWKYTGKKCYKPEPYFPWSNFKVSLNLSTYMQDLRWRALKWIPIIECLSKRF